MQRTGRSGSTSRRVRMLASSAAAAAVVFAGGVTPTTSATANATVATHQTEAARTHSIRIITYNVGGKSPSTIRAQLNRLLDRRPAVLGLQEVGDRRELLKQVARANPGYRLFQKDHGRVSRHNAILVRKRGVTVLAEGAKVLTEAAKVEQGTAGAKDGIAARKWVNWVRIKTDGLRWTAGVVHLVPSAERLGGLTRKLHLRQVAKCTEWWKSLKSEPLLMGDFNATLGHRYNLLKKLRAEAKPWTDISHSGRAIDYVWSRKGAKGSVKALPGYGGDHKPVLVNLTVTK